MLNRMNGRFELPVDLDLPPEIRGEVYALCAEIFATKRRLAREVVELGLSLRKLKAVMGDKFEDIALDTLGFARTSLYRYLKVASVYLVASNGMEDPSVLRDATTVTAFQLLDGASEEILCEVRERASRGEPINEALVKDLMSTQARLEQSLAAAQEQIKVQKHEHAEVERELSAKIDHLENEKTASKMAESQTANIAAEAQRRADSLSEDILALEESIRTLQAEIDRVKTEQTAEHQPARPLTEQEVVAFRSAELDRMNHEIAAATQKLADAEARLKQAEEEMAQAKTANDEVRNLQSDFQTFCGSLSKTLVFKTTLLSAESKQVLAAMTENLSRMLDTIDQYCGRGRNGSHP